MKYRSIVQYERWPNLISVTQFRFCQTGGTSTLASINTDLATTTGSKLSSRTTAHLSNTKVRKHSLKKKHAASLSNATNYLENKL